MRRLAISDIHGCARTFYALLDQCALSKGDRLFLLGDYVDRGPDARGVVELILDLRERGYQVDCLMGNHEELVIDAMQGREVKASWMRLEGQYTFRSFGVENPADLPEPYRGFFHSLQTFVCTEGFILTHAGLNFHYVNPLDDLVSMRWIRHWYADIRRDWLAERVIVHGHTPATRRDIEIGLGSMAQQGYLDIDAGCVFSQKYAVVNADSLGHLCAFDMDNHKLYFQKNIDFS